MEQPLGYVLTCMAKKNGTYNMMPLCCYVRRLVTFWLTFVPIRLHPPTFNQNFIFEVGEADSIQAIFKNKRKFFDHSKMFNKGSVFLKFFSLLLWLFDFVANFRILQITWVRWSISYPRPKIETRKLRKYKIPPFTILKSDPCPPVKYNFQNSVE